MAILAFGYVKSCQNKFMIDVTHHFSTGSLSVQIEQDIDPDDFFLMAERQNPKRSFLFVSQILGKHMPVSPQKMRDSYDQLAAQLPIDLTGPVLFVGMAETAVGLAAGVYRSYLQRGGQAKLITSTRHPVAGELLCEFTEDHSHATDHLLYFPGEPGKAAEKEQIKRTATLVLVDDEVTTGKTFCHLAQGLIDAGLANLQQIYTVCLTDWCPSDLSEQIKIPTISVSLINGRWEWQADQTAALPDLPKVNVTAAGNVSLSPIQNWGRLGCDPFQATLGMPENIDREGTYLVLGTGEFLWQPFLLAERIAATGAEVFVSSTTRSPVNPGRAIQQKFEFQDNYGLGIPNYCYNIDPDRYDRIFLCIETPEESVDPRLLTDLKKAEIITHG